jgi:polyketide biosynthesis enoyl-CoA hydratase PksI
VVENAVPMPDRLVLTAQHGDGVVSIQMADAAGKNAFSEPLAKQLEECLGRAALDREARVLVLLGLPDVFASGASKELLLELAAGEVSPADILLAKALLDIPVPTISAMEGHATGGGLALGLCADIVVMARESRYGASFMNMGFTPGMGMTRLFEHVLSPAQACELLFTGEFRRGREFQEKSGVNHVLPRAEVKDKAFDIARRIAEKPRLALETLKRALSIRRRQAFEESRTIEAMMHDITFRADDIRARIEDDYVE